METVLSMEDMLDALAKFIKKDKAKLIRLRRELNELLDVPMLADEIEEE